MPFELIEFLVLIFLVIIMGVLSVPANAQPATVARVTGRFEPSASINKLSAVLPLRFELNKGQTDHRVRFLAHGPGYSLFLTANGAVLKLERLQAGRTPGQVRATARAVVRLELVGAEPRVKVTGEEELAGKSNYFIGRDPRGWHTDVPTYGEVRYGGVYRGVDLVYYGRQGKLESDFRIGAGVDVGQVRMKVEGAERVWVNGEGGLELETAAGGLELGRPEGYQVEGARKQRVEVRYAWRGKDEVGFEVGRYRREEPLIIDPVLEYSTYLGGSGGDIAYGIVVDSSGDAYVTGSTASVNFPLKAAAQPSYGGDGDAFVSKINPTGSALVYSTYIGGSGADSGAGITIDSSGDAYVTGTTSSSNFPVTSGAFQATYGGGTSNAFVLKLNPAGSAILYATYLGGNAEDFGQAIAVDASGNAYVTGATQSPNFPTLNPIQIGDDGCITLGTGAESCASNAFVTKINSSGSALVYSTYLGGSDADAGQAIAVDAQGDAYIAGYANSTNFPTQNALQSANAGGTDAFVTELNPAGSTLIFSTYLGGSGNDQAYGLVLDSSGSIYIAGETQSADFPLTPNVFQTTYGGGGDAFVSKLSPEGRTLVYSTYIGGNALDQANALAVDSSGNVVVVGSTESANFPTLDPLQTILGISGASTCSSSTSNTTSVCSDAFIVKLGPSGTGLYSTYLGGSEADIAQAVALDPSGTPYVVGSTESSNFPVISGALQGAYAGAGTSTNAFIVKVGAGDAPGLSLTPQVVNFGNQTVKTTSNPQPVTLINEGSAPLEISGISATGDYAETNNCGTTVTPGGGSCTINITFTPQNTGSNTDEVTITDNAAGSPQEIAVTGTGTTTGAGTLTLTPSSIVFPAQKAGTTSSPQTVEIINASQTAITITALTISGDFAETNNCPATPFVLNAGTSCSASITFVPTVTAGGALTGSFSVTSNASGSPSVSLSSTATAPFSLSTTSLSQYLLIGTKKTTLTIAASAPSSFTSSITLSCSSGATCAFNPASITAGQASVVTVTGLSATSSNPTNITVTGTSGSETATLALSIFFSDFTLSATPADSTISAGESTNYTITVTPTYGFDSVVLFSCSNLPGDTTCSWRPHALQVSGSSPVTTALVTVATTSQLSGLLRFPGARGPTARLEGRGKLLLVGVCLLLLGILTSWRKLPSLFPKRGALALAILGLLLLALSGMSCTGNYEGFVGGNPSPIGTPSGVYTITLTGTLGNNSGVTRTTTVNLAVGSSE